MRPSGARATPVTAREGAGPCSASQIRIAARGRTINAPHVPLGCICDAPVVRAAPPRGPAGSGIRCCQPPPAACGRPRAAPLARAKYSLASLSDASGERRASRKHAERPAKVLSSRAPSACIYLKVHEPVPGPAHRRPRARWKRTKPALWRGGAAGCIC